MSGGVERRLAAIVAADVVGYSSLMEADEEGTIDALKAHRREQVDPAISAHGGRIVKTTGDGMLLEFASAVAAVGCALAIQRAMAEAADGMRFRIGVNLGDIVIEGEDILGEGVNVAARLEALAEPGGIAISANVHEQVQGKLDAVFADDGEHEVKNITRPIRVWRWAPWALTPLVSEALALPDKPSIAVLAFENMSGDVEQEYFADGIAEDVITALSRFRSLFVIARNSSFTFKGQAVDVTEVGRELGVGYVVEGSVRKAGNRVRITAQLIDARAGNHLWADRFDGALDDVFELQDRIAEQIFVAIEPEIRVAEGACVGRKPPESLAAWELLQQGLAHFHLHDAENQGIAIDCFRRAVALDPGFAAAHAHLGYALWTLAVFGLTDEVEGIAGETQELCERAITLDPNEAMGHVALGRLLAWTGDIETAIAEARQAIQLNPNMALGHYFLGFALAFGAGRAADSLPHYEAAIRLSPRDPLRWFMLTMKGVALTCLGRADKGLVFVREAAQLPGSSYWAPMHLAWLLAELGETAEARRTLAKAREMLPALSNGFLRAQFTGMHVSYAERLFEGLGKAGLAE